ncbi:MAG TPA: hypothetical protein VFB95_11715 [Candidatus Cryosericum sp.]|nr:hypothetical protein [Candidatus Cryosericum sp.]
MRRPAFRPPAAVRAALRTAVRTALVVPLIAASLTLHTQAGRSKPRTDPNLVAEVGRYRLQSNPWVNLHQRLMHEARFGTPPPGTLSGEGRSAWSQAVDAYRTFLGKRSPIFDDELIQMNAALSATSATAPPASIPEAPAAALATAMPLYRSAQWKEDDRANRFWIAVAQPMLASAAEELAGAHAKVYGTPFPTRILVDVSPLAWEFGGYTVGEGESAHVVISSTDPGYQGFAALEMLMHEPSHAIVAPASGAIGADLARIAREMGVKPAWNLWHAILFYTSGELTRRALAERGVSEYRPSVIGMYERGFRDFRQALETHWQAYLDGKVARDEAIRQILAETAPVKK